jgi:hypothetical protein
VLSSSSSFGIVIGVVIVIVIGIVIGVVIVIVIGIVIGVVIVIVIGARPHRHRRASSTAPQNCVNQ